MSAREEFYRSLIFVCFKCQKSLNLLSVDPLEDRDDLPIISLTSFPARFANLWIVIFQIFQQTFRPGKIILTLIEDEVGGGEETLPKSLLFFKDRGLEFLFEKDNLKPHNKYFYCMQKYPGRTVITIDDDTIYYRDTISRLMEMHAAHPDCVCANRARKIIPGMPYGKWPIDYNGFSTEDSQLMALGYGAVLYPGSFSYHNIFDKEKIRKLAPAQDDLWLMAMEMSMGIKVITGGHYPSPITLPQSQRVSLNSINNAEDSPNDRCIKMLSAEFSLSLNG